MPVHPERIGILKILLVKIHFLENFSRESVVQLLMQCMREENIEKILSPEELIHLRGKSQECVTGTWNTRGLNSNIK